MIRWCRWSERGLWHALAYADRDENGYPILITACGAKQDAEAVVNVTMGTGIPPSIGQPCPQCDGLVLLKRVHDREERFG